MLKGAPGFRCDISTQNFAWLLGPCCAFQSFCTINSGIREFGVFCSCPRVFAKIGQGSRESRKVMWSVGRQFVALVDRRKAAAFGLVCKLLGGECIGQLQQMCPNLIMQGQSQMCSRQTRSQCILSRTRIECKLRPRVDSYKRRFAAQIGQIFSEVPASVVEIGLQRGWRAAMKPGQRS